MELNALPDKLTKLLSKYRYPLCILLIGIVLMLIPATEQDNSPQPESVISEVPEVTVEERLSKLLSSISGAGRVEVLLSYGAGEQTVYHEDTDSEHRSAVIVTDGERNETALISRVDPPQFLGAIVVCQGADSAAVRLAIVEAVSKYTGLGADEIAVLKMK